MEDWRLLVSPQLHLSLSWQTNKDKFCLPLGGVDGFRVGDVVLFSVERTASTK